MSVYEFVDAAADGWFGRPGRTILRWLVIVLVLSSTLFGTNWFALAFNAYAQHKAVELNTHLVQPMLRAIDQSTANHHPSERPGEPSPPAPSTTEEP